MQLASLVLAGLASLVLALATSVIYNLIFHPLASFPGPRLAAASAIPYWNAQFKGNLARWVTELHKQHGDVVRINPWSLSFISPTAWTAIYGGRNEKENKRPVRPLRSKISRGTSLIETRGHHEHSELRRIFAPAFADRALKDQEDLFLRHIDKFVALLTRKAADPATHIDLQALLNFTTFDVMGDLAFGEPLGLLDNSEYTPWVRTTFDSIRFSVIFEFLSTYPLIGRLFLWLRKNKLSEAGASMNQFSVERVEKRLAKERIEPDIWSLVLRHADLSARTASESASLQASVKSGKALLAFEDLVANARLFMLAGTETTATLLGGLTYQLLRNPRCMHLLKQEIRDACSSSDAISMDVLPKLPYMTACISEAFRCYPPVPIGLARQVQDTMLIDNHVVPKGAIVSVFQLAAYQNPRNFADPTSFIPERWLAHDESFFSSDRKDVLRPFSVGPRNCIGQNMAYHEMRLILAKLIWHFDIALCDESKDWLNQKNYALWEKKPLWITAQARA